MRRASSPKVSIGLPVLNGESHVAAAISSILEQTYEDFELVVCDNASTDRTGEICRAFAARDARIRYHRNPANIGAAPNFELVYHLASGEYFKWAAHDDLLEPAFLERCVAALDADPEAVLCFTGVRRIDGERDLGICHTALQGADSPCPSERFAALVLRPHMCTEIFGLIRARALAGTPLVRAYHGSERTLLAILALRGRIIGLPEPLFVHRDHHEPWHERAAWQAQHDRSKAGVAAWNSWTLYAELFRAVVREVADPPERRLCFAHLLRWPLVGDHARSLAADLLWRMNARAFRAARGVRRWAARSVGRALEGAEPVSAPVTGSARGAARLASSASPAQLAQVYAIADHPRRRHAAQPRVVVRRELGVAGLANGQRALDHQKPGQPVGHDVGVVGEQPGAAAHKVIPVAIQRARTRQPLADGTVLEVRFPRQLRQGPLLR